MFSAPLLFNAMILVVRVPDPSFCFLSVHVSSALNVSHARLQILWVRKTLSVMTDLKNLQEKRKERRRKRKD